jgi:hypothetical protein
MTTTAGTADTVTRSSTDTRSPATAPSPRTRTAAFIGLAILTAVALGAIVAGVLLGQGGSRTQPATPSSLVGPVTTGSGQVGLHSGALAEEHFYGTRSDATVEGPSDVTTRVQPQPARGGRTEL